MANMKHGGPHSSQTTLVLGDPYVGLVRRRLTRRLPAPASHSIVTNSRQGRGAGSKISAICSHRDRTEVWTVFSPPNVVPRPKPKSRAVPAMTPSGTHYFLCRILFGRDAFGHRSEPHSIRSIPHRSSIPSWSLEQEWVIIAAGGICMSLGEPCMEQLRRIRRASCLQAMCWTVYLAFDCHVPSIRTVQLLGSLAVL